MLKKKINNYFLLLIITAIVWFPVFSYAAVVNITRNATVFTPSSVTITAGDQIKWINTSGGDIQPSSNPHPDHTNYTALNMGVIVNGASSTTAALNSVGTWGYHDHLNDGVGGTIVIQAAAPSSTPAAVTGYTPVIPPPSVVEFSVNEITAGSASISWRTDYYSYTKLKYGTTSRVYSDEFSTDLSLSRFEHSARLINLIPDMTYYLMFITGRPWLYTEVVTSTEKTFKTLAEPKIKNQPENEKLIVEIKKEEVKAPEKDVKTEIKNTPPIPQLSFETRRKIADIQSELLKILKQVLEIMAKIQALPR
ncbi:MAG: hypothetical protein AAB772_01560 [Patescibacteria group bacterium]